MAGPQKVLLTSVRKGLVRINPSALEKSTLAFWKDLSKLAKGQAQDVADLSVRKGKTLSLPARLMEATRFFLKKNFTALKNFLSRFNFFKRFNERHGTLKEVDVAQAKKRFEVLKQNGAAKKPEAAKSAVSPSEKPVTEGIQTAKPTAVPSEKAVTDATQAGKTTAEAVNPKASELANNLVEIPVANGERIRVTLNSAQQRRLKNLVDRFVDLLKNMPPHPNKALQKLYKKLILNLQALQKELNLDDKTFEYLMQAFARKK